MKKIAVELIKIAKELVAVPMGIIDPDIQTLRWAEKSLMMMLGVDRSWKEIYSSFLTYQDGGSNKFHYFAVYKKGAECVGGNSYGRIGYNPKAIEVARGSEGMVMSSVQAKVRIKRQKGYTPTEV
jgi:predicted DNA-binding WGR domain protein